MRIVLCYFSGCVGFSGVAARRLDGYLAWHNFMKYLRRTNVERKQILLRQVLTLFKKVVYE